jgi:hypothetical protein
MTEGIVVAFRTRTELQEAMRQLPERDDEPLESYTPAFVDEEEPASVLPLVMLIAGFAGFAAGLFMQVYANALAYPLDIGGRPELSWPAFVPIAFEIGVLCAVLAGFFGYFIVCRLPHLYDPVDECRSMRRATRDLWIAVLRSRDHERIERARVIARELGASSIMEIGS